MPAGDSTPGTDTRLTDAGDADASTALRCQQASQPQDRAWSAAHDQPAAA